ncbi:DNA-directed RNA polymerase subunit beta (apicoplast) [Theileria parva strain Muguga]|uniref:DNA-directed RNA polymerase n=1 Tax=Theileria parva TaxID=5875 RepID=Q4MY81_THEPA|nr:DNA-directed RNA polymerase subunit beta [Theileria parva strain Muguga]|eukprot:XP_762711.1 DNA-directed RNA polymerase subunit beta'' (apicoplast) [Theileria parva strain Muguga]
MKNIVSKNFKFLSLFNLFNIEKYLQELVSLSFEYSSEFIFSYNTNDFKNIPIDYFPKNVSKNLILDKFLYLINMFLERDSFFNYLYLYLILNFKIKFNHFVQILGLRGRAEMKGYKGYISSNLNYGFTFKDFILSSFKARESIIDSSVNIYSSGYLTRKLVEGLRDMNIKEIKCTTKYICKDIKNNCDLRLPFLCLSNKATCSFCLNIISDNTLFLGYNKGIISGQALGEPSTQMLLRTFHLGGGGLKVTNINKSTHDLNVKDKHKFINIDNKNNDFMHINSYNSYKNNCKINYDYVKLIPYNNKVNTFENNKYSKFLSLFKNFSVLWVPILFNKYIFKYNIFNNSNSNIGLYLKKFLSCYTH